MKTLIFIPTLHCGGRCEEAIELYKKAFNLEVDWQGKDEQTNMSELKDKFGFKWFLMVD